MMLCVSQLRAISYFCMHEHQQLYHFVKSPDVRADILTAESGHHQTAGGIIETNSENGLPNVHCCKPVLNHNKIMGKRNWYCLSTQQINGEFLLKYPIWLYEPLAPHTIMAGVSNEVIRQTRQPFCVMWPWMWVGSGRKDDHPGIKGGCKKYVAVA